MSRRLALIIGMSLFEDSALSRLQMPEADVQAFEQLLGNPSLASFDRVLTVTNKPHYEIQPEITTFLEEAKLSDLVLLYFSGHGVLDENGRLFLACKNTKRNRLNSTAIPTIFITEELDKCRAKRQVLILDCCHSGAFGRGTKSGGTAITRQTFETNNGYGRIVLTASDSTQAAFEGDVIIEQMELSLFTHFLIEGIETGAADDNEDGQITLDEWYDYVYHHVRQHTHAQTPKKWSYNQEGDIIISRSPRSEPDKLISSTNAMSAALGVESSAVSDERKPEIRDNPPTAKAKEMRVSTLKVHNQEGTRTITIKAQKEGPYFNADIYYSGSIIGSIASGGIFTFETPDNEVGELQLSYTIHGTKMSMTSITGRPISTGEPTVHIISSKRVYIQRNSGDRTFRCRRGYAFLIFFDTIHLEGV